MPSWVGYYKVCLNLICMDGRAASDPPTIVRGRRISAFLRWFESNNGFDLLWRVLELSVPGFKSTNPVQVPIWSSATSILSFCHEYLLYFHLQAKHNIFFNAQTQTNIFLRNILHSEYADIVTTLQ
jgi:hypothetical protein